jgi:8-oxo-dGTP pyrophosphatase MutT (NUDIX family)
VELCGSLPERIAQRLANPLPGAAAQSRFASELCYGRHSIPPFPDTRHAAVLVLLYRTQGAWHIPLILRPPHMSLHANQVSFPGGERHSGESAEETALREFEEELGVPSDAVVLLGRLSPLFVFGSNYLVTPCVASASGRPAFAANPAEVARLLELPLATLFDPGARGVHWIHREGVSYRAPHIEFQSCRIWGATSMMLAEFTSVLDEVGTS